MKKLAALVLSGTLLLGGTACGNAGEPFGRPPADESAVHIGIAETVENLDPAAAVTRTERTLAGHLFEGLTRADPDGGIAAAAAEGWTVGRTGDAAGRPVYVFTLREGSVWSDGSPLTAEDFVYAWTRVISGKTECPDRYLFRHILGASDYETAEADGKKPDLGLETGADGTLRVTLEGDCAYFPALLSLPAFAPVPAGTVEAHPDGWSRDAGLFVGNGPFRLAGREEDGTLILRRNERYAGTVTDRTLVWTPLSREALERGAEDGTVNLTEERFRRPPLAETEDGSLYCFCLNCDRLTDPDLRKALRLAFDPERVLREASLNETTPVGGTPLKGLLPGETILKPDAAEAAELMRGLGNPPEELVLLTTADPENENGLDFRLASAAAEAWRENLGVRVTVRALPYADFEEARGRGEYDIARAVFILDFPDPAAVLELFDGGGPGNAARYESRKFDGKLSESRSRTDPDRRSALLREAEETLLLEDSALLPLRAGRKALFGNGRLTGIAGTGLGTWDFRSVTYGPEREE